MGNATFELGLNVMCFPAPLHYQLAIGLECWYQLEGFFRLLYSNCVVLWAGSDCVFSLF